jgi:hypothetical protein
MLELDGGGLGAKKKLDTDQSQYPASSIQLPALRVAAALGQARFLR